MNIPKEIESWLVKAKAAVEANTKKEYPTCEVNWRTLNWNAGRKYIRVFTQRTIDGDHRSAYCFIDANGVIYMSATWHRPAKGGRGTIGTVDPAKLSSSTGWLYR